MERNDGEQATAGRGNEVGSNSPLLPTPAKIEVGSNSPLLPTPAKIGVGSNPPLLPTLAKIAVGSSPPLLPTPAKIGVGSNRHLRSNGRAIPSVKENGKQREGQRSQGAPHHLQSNAKHGKQQEG